MSSSLSAAYYADQAVQRTVEIVEQIQLAQATFRLRFICPEIARCIQPGQFVMLRIAGVNDPLIGRPLALYDVVHDAEGTPVAVDVVYLVKGRFTRRLAECLPSQKIEVWGPLGNGFPPPSVDHLIVVAGGIGQTPFLALCKESLGLQQFGDPPRVAPRVKRITFCYGARSAAMLAGVEDFERTGANVVLATDDGSRGHHGFVTDLLLTLLGSAEPARSIVCCGPEPMMEAVARIAHAKETPCQVSLETPMACGIGICFTCVARIRDDTGGWDYKRTCVDGPVFSADAIQW